MSAPDTTAVPLADVSAIRAFNRFFTHRVGVLKPGLLDSPWSLTEVRIMYELRHRARIEALDLRRELDMDAGQLSRVLTRLQHSGLVVRSPSAEDGRRQVVELTDAGSRAAVLMNDRANEQVTELVAHLGSQDRQRLIDAMGTVRRLFEAPGPAQEGQAPATYGDRTDQEAAAEGSGEALLRGLRPGDLGWIVERHGTLYAGEYDWDPDFEAWVARIVADYGRAHDPGAESVWIAELDGRRAGCISCVREDEATARLRLFLVEPSARGRGIGSLLVGRCLDFAREAGYRHMVLSTYSVLASARRIYQAAGFHLVSEEPERVFGHDLTAQMWERDL